MKVINNKVIGLYGMLIIYLLYRLVSMGTNIIDYNNWVNLILISIIGIYSYVLSKGSYVRYNDRYDKVQTTFIVVTIYLMVEFLIGLIVGYQKSPYSHSFLNNIKNTLIFLIPVIMQEYARLVLVNHTKRYKKPLTIAIIVLFILIDLNFIGFTTNFSNFEVAFKYTFTTIVPLIAKNMLFTYLVSVGGVVPSTLYRILMMGYSIYLPILPNISWFITSLAGIFIPLAVYVFINYREVRMNRRSSRELIRESSPVSYIPITIFAVVLMLFVLGYLPYMPIAVKSNSMSPVFERGWVVITKKITEEQLKTIEKDSIIKYRLNNNYIIHRVIDIETDKDGNLLFTTKGDANNAPDVDKVKAEQIDGVVIMQLPYIGFPSVWLSELL